MFSKNLCVIIHLAASIAFCLVRAIEEEGFILLLLSFPFVTHFSDFEILQEEDKRNFGKHNFS